MNAPTARPVSPQAALALTVIAVSAVVGGWGLLRERMRGPVGEPAAAPTGPQGDEGAVVEGAVLPAPASSPAPQGSSL